MMKNKNGQVLVAFVLLLPLMFMLCGVIVDRGYVYIEKRKMDNSVKSVIEFALKNKDTDRILLEEKIRKNLNTNISDIDDLTIVLDDKVDISISKKQKSIFSVLLSKDSYLVTSHYLGYIDGDVIIIRKV